MLCSRQMKTTHFLYVLTTAREGFWKRNPRPPLPPEQQLVFTGERPNGSVPAEIPLKVRYIQFHAMDLRKCHVFFSNCLNCRKLPKETATFTTTQVPKSSATINTVSTGCSISFSVSYLHPCFAT